MAAVAAAGAAVVWVGAGGGTGGTGMPLPAHPVSAAPGQPVTGPTAAVVDGTVITAWPDPAAALTAGSDEHEHDSGRVSAPPPSSLFIPALGRVAPVDVAAVTTGNLLQLPHDPARVAIWDEGSALEESTGVKLVGGHVTNGWRKGALYRLADLQAGNVAYTTDRDGVVRMWQLESLQSVPRASGADTVADVEGDALVVMTCGGPVITAGGERVYRDNVVAVFRPA